MTHTSNVGKRLKSLHAWIHKLLQRAYFIPEGHHKIWPSASKYCWRNCVGVGDIFHVFWTCSPLKCFWADVFCLISNIIGTSIQVEPAMGLFHLYLDHMPRGDRYLTEHFLVAAKASIAQLWKSYHVPCLQENINKVHKHSLFETADCSDSSFTSSFYLRWINWEVYRAE